MKLPRTMRMRRQSEFLQVRRKGRSCAGRFLVLACLREGTIADFRFGFVTSKRVGSAVARNRVRRRLRAIVQREGAKLKRGYYVVTIARRGAAEASFAELHAEWLKLAGRVKLLAGEAG